MQEPNIGRLGGEGMPCMLFLKLGFTEGDIFLSRTSKALILKNEIMKEHFFSSQPICLITNSLGIASTLRPTPSFYSPHPSPSTSVPLNDTAPCLHTLPFIHPT